MRLTLIIAVVLLAAVVGWFVWNQTRPDRPPNAVGELSSSAAAGDGNSAGGAAGQVGVAALGRLEPAEGVVQIGAIPGDRLVQLLVGVGDDVPKDAELAHLGSRSLRQAERDLAQIRLDDAQARVKAEKFVAATVVAEAQVAVEQSRLQGLDINNQEAQVGLAEANLEQVQKELARLAGLSAELVPPQDTRAKEAARKASPRGSACGDYAARKAPCHDFAHREGR